MEANKKFVFSQSAVLKQGPNALFPTVFFLLLPLQDVIEAICLIWLENPPTYSLTRGSQSEECWLKVGGAKMLQTEDEPKGCSIGVQE